MWQIRELSPNEVERVGAVLGLARLEQGDGYDEGGAPNDGPTKTGCSGTAGCARLLVEPS